MRKIFWIFTVGFSVCLASCQSSGPKTSVAELRNPAQSSNLNPQPESNRQLIVLVHGYAGSQLFDSARKKAKNVEELRHAFFGDYAALAKVFSSYLKDSGRTDVDLFVFRYNTLGRSNVASARILNLGLLGKVETDSAFPAEFPRFNQLLPGRKIEDYKQIHFVTLSNGNLVAREAVMQAFGIKDSREESPEGTLKYAAILKSLDPGFRVTEDFAKIEADPRLQAIYARASIHDVSPILAGAADARGAIKPFYRHRQVSPFGEHTKWLFSNENIKKYDEALAGRHFTYFVVGDYHTRGLWEYWCKQTPAVMNIVNRSGAFVQGQPWKFSNEEWLKRFELARGADQAHHSEYVQDFASDEMCKPSEYLGGNRILSEEFREKPNSLYNRYQNQPEVLARLEQRTKLPQDHFMKLLSTDVSDYFAEEMVLVHEGDGLAKAAKKGFFRKDGTRKSKEEVELLERHSVLVFYKPLLTRLGIQFFGPEFQDWIKKHGPNFQF